MLASTAGRNWSLSQPPSPQLCQLGPPVQIRRGDRMQSPFLSEKNLRGGSDSAIEETEKVTELQGPCDNEPQRGSKILKRILTIGRVALEACGFAFITMHITGLIVSLWLTASMKPGGGMDSMISQILTPTNAPSTGSLVGDIITSVIQAIVLPLVLVPIILIIVVSSMVVPAFVGAAASMSGILSLTFFAGFARPARLLLDLAGVFALVWYAVENVQNGQNGKGNV